MRLLPLLGWKKTFDGFFKIHVDDADQKHLEKLGVTSLSMFAALFKNEDDVRRNALEFFGHPDPLHSENPEIKQVNKVFVAKCILVYRAIRIRKLQQLWEAIEIAFMACGT